MTAPGRVAEHVLRSRPFGPKVRLRVDLHGVSMFPPDGRHTLIRWEWIEGIHLDDGVEVRSPTSQVKFPAGAFGVAPEELAGLLEQARSIEGRADVIEQLSRPQLRR